jgi:hypothetical protein
MVEASEFGWNPAGEAAPFVDDQTNLFPQFSQNFAPGADGVPQSGQNRLASALKPGVGASSSFRRSVPS